MLTLKEILNEMYFELSRSETIEKVSINDKFPKEKFSEIWKIKTEIEVRDFQIDVGLFIGFDEFFPLVIPNIYLSEESFDEIYPIPHVDKNRLICTFHTDSLILDTDNPLGILRICLGKAKKIIKEGLEGTNHGDYKDEIMAYWTDSEESDIIHYFSLLSELPGETTFLKICKLNPEYNHIKYLIYKNSQDTNTKKILDFFLAKGCKGSESNALFLCDYKINHKSHFPKSNDDILNSISLTSSDAFKKYINSGSFEKHVFFLGETSSNPILLGWKHRSLITIRKGFRQRSLTAFSVLIKYQKYDKIKRIFVNEYSNNRIENRTSGILRNRYTFLVAGLGSIGSNLIYFLNGLNYPKFKLIDNDVLKIENIGRHLLGITNINSFKSDALKAYIQNIRPDQNVSIKTSKIETIVTRNQVYFNDCSYAFIAIGNQNIENYLLKKQNDGMITVPMFFLWVEPYAIGGHCLFLHPEDKITLDNLYIEHLYRFNIVAPYEYKNSNPVLSKQEAGCQTSYTPYSGNDIILFLSAIYKWMNDIIQNRVKISMAIQWTGNINFSKELGLALNEPYARNEAYTINLIPLNDDSKER